MKGEFSIKREGTPIVGSPVASKGQAQALLKEKAPNWLYLVDLYWSISAIYSIRPDIALAQACKETGYFRFAGAVKPDMNNFCGLKTSKPSGDKTSDHAAFPDPPTGVEAHIQHLFAYASTDPIPAGRKLVDPRFDIVAKVVGRGVVKSVEELGGKWASNPNYGKSIVTDYLNKMLAYKIEENINYKALFEEEKRRNQQLNQRIQSLEQILAGIAAQTQPFLKKN
ncbi:MAG: glucosaminidase domain-containing protein [Bacillota bacterium]|uniref:glucosaminidase domain-containing protein n=1 Tax=Desulforamulus profundi TaxID=1383067 RepID=UPI000BFF7E18|nr:glucosaminidase domain-containing protein [Desulforamulus profundi]